MVVVVSTMMISQAVGLMKRMVVLVFLVMAAVGMITVASAASPVLVTRGPYLDSVSSNEATVRIATTATGGGFGVGVSFGMPPSASPAAAGDGVHIKYRKRSATSSSTTTTNESPVNKATAKPTTSGEYAFTLSSLQPNTIYEYQVVLPNNGGGGAAAFPFAFRTYPSTSASSSYPITLWAIGDSGEGSPTAKETVDRFLKDQQLIPWHATLALGDNAYQIGSAPEYDTKFFRMFGAALALAPVSATVGNHEAIANRLGMERGAHFDRFGRTSSGSLKPPQAPSNDIQQFLLRGGGAAAAASSSKSNGGGGSQLYHSFDIGRGVHVISIDSQHTAILPNGDPNFAKFQKWLVDDLERTTADWIVVYMHHPLFSKGHHDTTRDSDHKYSILRQRLVPVFDKHGVDIVLSGHSHAYERTTSALFNNERVQDSADGDCLDVTSGTAYVVTGSASKKNPGQFNHPLMGVGLFESGSVILRAESPQRMNVRFLSNEGDGDEFQIVKGSGASCDGDSSEVRTLSLASQNLQEVEMKRNGVWRERVPSGRFGVRPSKRSSTASPVPATTASYYARVLG